MNKKLILLLIGYSLLVTIALAWALGRASAPALKEKVAKVAAAPKLEEVKVEPAVLRPKPMEPMPPKSKFPEYQSTIPKAFRGRWDEIIADRCDGREARFYFGERDFANFEVQWEVTNVKLYSPVEMDLSTTTTDDENGQVNEVWEFKLVDNGKTLTGRKKGASFFKRCPVV